MTLVELTVVVGVISIILVSLCEIYFAVGREWERQQGSAAALAATSQACTKLADYMSQSVDLVLASRFTANDSIAVCLPANTAHGIYVPVLSGNKLKYKSGTWVLFYLSDSTGNYASSGNILWSGTLSTPALPSSVVPDSTWSKYANGVGRYTPITSMQFTPDYSGSRYAVQMTISSSYTINRVTNSQAQLQQTENVCLWNNGTE